MVMLDTWNIEEQCKLKAYISFFTETKHYGMPSDTNFKILGTIFFQIWMPVFTYIFASHGTILLEFENDCNSSK